MGSLAQETSRSSCTKYGVRTSSFRGSRYGRSGRPIVTVENGRIDVVSRGSRFETRTMDERSLDLVSLSPDAAKRLLPSLVPRDKGWSERLQRHGSFSSSHPSDVGHCESGALGPDCPSQSPERLLPVASCKCVTTVHCPVSVRRQTPLSRPHYCGLTSHDSNLRSQALKMSFKIENERIDRGVL